MTDDARSWEMLMRRLDTIQGEMRDHRDESRNALAEFRNEVTATRANCATGHQQADKERKALFAKTMENKLAHAEHLQHHGLDEDKRPSPWVANFHSWAYHHPRRTLLCSLGFVALFFSPVRAWLVANARTVIGLAFP